MDVIRKRRSIRRYKPTPVPEDVLTNILEAARLAPSAGNRQPWHFVVVTDPDMRNKLADIHPHAQMVRQSPVCIVPCGEPRLSFPGMNDYWIQDLSAATENILLAAVGLGLGAVWCGVYPVPERVKGTREVLGIPEEVVPFAYIAVGYPAEHKEPRTQYDPSRVHPMRW